jgi:hypothetical protein
MGLPGSFVLEHHLGVNLEIALVSLVLRIANLARNKRLVLDASIRNDGAYQRILAPGPRSLARETLRLYENS